MRKIDRKGGGWKKSRIFQCGMGGENILLFSNLYICHASLEIMEKIPGTFLTNSLNAGQMGSEVTQLIFPADNGVEHSQNIL